MSTPYQKKIQRRVSLTPSHQSSLSTKTKAILKRLQGSPIKTTGGPKKTSGLISSRPRNNSNMKTRLQMLAMRARTQPYWTDLLRPKEAKENAQDSTVPIETEDILIVSTVTEDRSIQKPSRNFFSAKELEDDDAVVPVTAPTGTFTFDPPKCFTYPPKKTEIPAPNTESLTLDSSTDNTSSFESQEISSSTERSSKSPEKPPEETNIVHSVTTESTPLDVTTAPEWACPTCFVQNKGSVCVCCGMTKDGTSTSAPISSTSTFVPTTFKSTVPEVSAKYSFGLSAKAPEKQNASITSSLPADIEKCSAAAAPQAVSWTCSTCFVQNKESVCICCGMTKDGTSTSAPTTSVATFVPTNFKSTIPETSAKYSFGLSAKTSEKQNISLTSSLPEKCSAATAPQAVSSVLDTLSSKCGTNSKSPEKGQTTKPFAFGNSNQTYSSWTTNFGTTTAPSSQPSIFSGNSSTMTAPQPAKTVDISSNCVTNSKSSENGLTTKPFSFGNSNKPISGNSSIVTAPQPVQTVDISSNCVTNSKSSENGLTTKPFSFGNSNQPSLPWTTNFGATAAPSLQPSIFSGNSSTMTAPQVIPKAVAAVQAISTDTSSSNPPDATALWVCGECFVRNKGSECAFCGMAEKDVAFSHASSSSAPIPAPVFPSPAPVSVFSNSTMNNFSAKIAPSSQPSIFSGNSSAVTAPQAVKTVDTSSNCESDIPTKRFAFGNSNQPNLPWNKGSNFGDPSVSASISVPFIPSPAPVPVFSNSTMTNFNFGATTAPSSQPFMFSSNSTLSDASIGQRTMATGANRKIALARRRKK